MFEILYKTFFLIRGKLRWWVEIIHLYKENEGMEGKKTNQNSMFMLRSLWYFISELYYFYSLKLIVELWIKKIYLAIYSFGNNLISF